MPAATSKQTTQNEQQAKGRGRGLSSIEEAATATAALGNALFPQGCFDLIGALPTAIYHTKPILSPHHAKQARHVMPRHAAHHTVPARRCTRKRGPPPLRCQPPSVQPLHHPVVESQHHSNGVARARPAGRLRGGCSLGRPRRPSPAVASWRVRRTGTAARQIAKANGGSGSRQQAAGRLETAGSRQQAAPSPTVRSQSNASAHRLTDYQSDLGWWRRRVC